MARRADHTREELRNLILWAACKIVEEDGFSGLTARSVASRMAYAPGTIYNVFSSMDDLCLGINGMTLDNLHGVLSGAVCNDPKKTPAQNVKAMARLYRDFARENRARWLMLFTHALPEGEKAPDWYRDKIEKLFTPLEGLLEPFFSGQQAQRHKMAARTLWASVHGIFFLEETGKIPFAGGVKKAPDMAGYLIDHFLSGLMKNGH